MIALVTCYFQHNYGSQLQALATQMAMKKMGLDCETIRIDGLKSEIKKAKYKYFLSKIFDAQTVKDKMATVRKVLAKKTNATYASNLAVRDNAFEKFAKEQFTLSKCYNSKKELAMYAKAYDAFIVGSDQLWLPSNIAADYYTLNFVPKEITKIAYATSFGVSTLPARTARKARRFLKRFDAIMLREVSGQKLVKRLIRNDVPLVCDPTMLFDANEWNEILPDKRYVNDKYILCYFLGNNQAHREFAARLANDKGLKIVQLPHLDEYIIEDEGFADEQLYNINPLDFVALIRDAEYVLTDSFHCTVFSNLFQKKFFTFRRYKDDGTASTNSRLYSLLEILGESDRLLRGNEDSVSISDCKIDYSAVHEKISKLRTESFCLLSEALSLKETKQS